MWIIGEDMLRIVLETAMTRSPLVMIVEYLFTE